MDVIRMVIEEIGWGRGLSEFNCLWTGIGGGLL
jgi:hypothetical protein